MLQQAISLSLLTAMAAIPPAVSQGIQGNIRGVATTTAPALRVLVATPYPSSPADSANAVVLGNAIRNKLNNSIGGSDWLVITRRDMNDYLIKWGYAADQLFAPETARQMVTPMLARMFVMTTMVKEPDGRYSASVRVTGASDDAGHVIKGAQAAGQTLQDFGNKLGDQIAVIFKAYPDARQCNDNLTVNRSKAVDGANKAIKTVPNYGFPEYCLGLLEQMKDSVGPETVRHFRNALVGDPLSIKAVSQISIIDQKKGDTNAVVSDFEKMLTIQPTNVPLANEAYKIFRQWGRPDAADQLADAQMKLDPTSADWPDLKGNSCAAAGAGATDPKIAKDKFKCAYDAFTLVYQLDPTRADTNFYPKIVFVAGSRADSMLWAKRWAEKYASMTDPYKLEMQIYMDADQVDSALTIVKLLDAVDPTDVKPVLAVEMAMLKAHHLEDALKLTAYFPKGADETGKNQFAGLLVQAADSETRSPTRNDSTLMHVGHALVAFDSPNKAYVDFGHYFIVTSYVPGLQLLSQTSRSDKSCDTVKKYEALLAAMDADPSMKALAASSNANLATFATGLAKTISEEKPRMPELEKAFCKPAGKP